MQRFCVAFAVIAVILVAAMTPSSALAQTPSAADVAAKASSKLKGATGIKAVFRLDAGGNKMKGTLLSSGRKFRILSDAYSAWFDGKTLFTLNPRTRETTVVTPTGEELREANPLLFMDGVSSAYSLAFASHQPAGKYMLVLTPKKKNDPLKSVFITLNKSTFLPEVIVVTGSDGSVSTLTVSSINTGMKIGQGIFIYPASKYSGIKLVDLR